MDPLDGSVQISWVADGYTAIRVYAPWRERSELDAFARVVADVALMHRSVGELQVALRREFRGAFDFDARRVAAPGQVVISFHPPKGTPNPDL